MADLSGRSCAKVLKAGQNCGEVAQSARVAVLIDASEYYRRLEQALGAAQQSILVIGWDFDGRIKLCPQNDKCPPLGEFLRSLAEIRPALHIRILVWSGAVVHTPSASAPLLFGDAWQEHERIVVKLDRHHPIYASHHQKIVAIDDQLAFAGGIDLTVERWDTCDHKPGDLYRIHPDGRSYPPVHDVQAVVNGDAAKSIGQMARSRWQLATGEQLARPDVTHDIWPPDLRPDFVRSMVGIARTAPGWGDTAPVAEIAALTDDMLESAQKHIYIEAQYLTASRVRRFLTRSLAEKNGPEVVIVLNKSSPGILERFAMGANGERMMRRLRQADRHNRLRIYHPVVHDGDETCDVSVHAKVMIIDDRLLRIGSANINNRSMGLDTECDLVVEASSAPERRAIVAVRNRLLSEHLGVEADEFGEAMSRTDSLIHAIDEYNKSTRRLKPFAELDIDGPTEPISLTKVMDPRRPFRIF